MTQYFLNDQLRRLLLQVNNVIYSFIEWNGKKLSMNFSMRRDISFPILKEVYELWKCGIRDEGEIFIDFVYVRSK